MTYLPIEPSNNKTLAIIIFSLLLVCYIIFVVLLRINLPETEKLIQIVNTVYRTIGYPLVYGAATAEATFPVGLYFPGSTIVMLGSALSRTGEILWLFVYLCAVAGCMTGYSINYFLGRHGWVRFLRVLGFEKGLDQAKHKLQENERKAIAFGCMSATTGAFLSTSAGMMKIPFWRFFFSALLAQSFWSALWGAIAYIFGYAFVELFLKYIIFIIWGVVIVYLLKVYLIKK